MTCPVCGDGLREIATATGPRQRRCERCGGTWIAAADHRAWLAESGGAAADGETLGTGVGDVVAWELAQGFDPAKRCPVDGHILRKFAVGGDLAFRLDRCGTCHGAWLDPGEWAALGRAGLQHQLAEVFTESWQDRARGAEARRTREELLTARFGAEDLARLREVRTWLADKPLRSAMIAFLSSVDDQGEA